MRLASLSGLSEPWTSGDVSARFRAMKPLRDYVMNHYRLVGLFGEQVLFERKP